MKRPLVLATLIVILASGAARADWPHMRPYLGVFGGYNAVTRDWDLGQHLYDGVKPASSAVAGLRVGLQALRTLALEINAGWLPETPKGGSGRQSVFSFDAAVLVHLTRGRFAPFVEGGVGGYLARGGALGSDTDPLLHVGVGARGLLASWLALRLEARDMISDGKDDGGAHNAELTLGLDFFLPGHDHVAPPPAPAPADKDHDGVSDADDKCPDVAGKPELGGCPDKDGDGVTDADDKCPDVAGKPELGGCPDKDGDGVTDADDKCPDVAGKPELGGCPDKDGDGITDADDKCPDVAGKPELAGCPDKDGDGVTDADDKCPDVAGKPGLAGCPDRDGDDVADADDKCPDVPGLVELQGCLPPEAQKFSGVIKGITFKTGSAKILKPSFKVLDGAIKVLVQYTALRIRVEGHTDNVGAPEVNQTLSQARADAVREYLVGKGVAEGRIEAVGYGDTHPKADNKQAKGRAQNRRIEFTLLGHDATPPAPPAPAPAPAPPDAPPAPPDAPAPAPAPTP